MDRISTATKAVDLFGAGKHGFKDGNLGLGIAPTDFNAAWFNGAQEEMLAVIEGGGLVPNSGTLNQLLQALPAALASRPEMAKSLAANGYQKLPGGLLVQWGSYTAASWVSAALTFPIAFPVACRSLQIVESNTSTPHACASTSITTSGFTAYIAAAASGFTVHWIAIGY